jgi:hypothetical protein
MNDSLLHHFLEMEDEPKQDMGDLHDFDESDEGDQDGWRDALDSSRDYDSHCQSAAEER